MSGEANQVKWRGVQPVAGIRGVWPAIDSERINKGDSQVSVGTKIIYTVPANKILFIDSAVFFSRSKVAQLAYPYSFVRNAADVLQYVMVQHYYTTAGQYITPMHWLPAIEAPAGYDVTVKINFTNVDARVDFFGWLEDA